MPLDDTSTGAREKRAFLCPIPPTGNNLTRNTSEREKAAMRARGKGTIPRVKTITYKNWREQAGWRLKLQGVQPLIAKSYQLSIAAPVNHARDLGNCLKATEDLLVWLGIISDDRWIDSIRLDRMTEGKEMYVTLKVLA